MMGVQACPVHCSSLKPQCDMGALSMLFVLTDHVSLYVFMLTLWTGVPWSLLCWNCLMALAMQSVAVVWLQSPQHLQCSRRYTCHIRHLQHQGQYSCHNPPMSPTNLQPPPFLLLLLAWLRAQSMVRKLTH